MPTTMMTTEDNKALVRRFIDEIFLEGKPEAVDELLADDFVPHNWGKTGTGKSAMTEAIKRASAGLSDAQMTIEDVIAEGDKVAVRLTSHAVQTGPFMGLPPSGKPYTIEEIHIFRIRDGLLVEHWHAFDRMALLGQLKGDTEG